MADSSIIDSLVDMGFSRENSEFALKKTKTTNVQEIIDWMLSHSNEIDELRETETESSTSVENTTSTETAQEAKSIKCEDCGKLFRNADEVEFHAVRSGHSNFSESTEEKRQLTDEEKIEKRLLLEAVIKEKRRQREEKEKLEALEREKRRIRSGKDLTEAKKRLEDLEMKKMIDCRKREKIEDQLARERVRLRIEEDKLARKQKFNQAAGVEPPVEHVQVTSPSTQSKSTVPKNTCTETRLQIRLLDGSSVTENFGPKEPLSAVRLFLELNYPDIPKPFSLMTAYPRREFQGDDFNCPLEALDLVPSAVVIMKKCN